MSCGCERHGVLGYCAECTTYDANDQLTRIGDLLERLADVLAPTPEQIASRHEDKVYERSRIALMEWDRIASEQTGRGVR